jgi:hypothetical protein
VDKPVEKYFFDKWICDISAQKPPLWKEKSRFFGEMMKM